jgi:hypothetical protein
MTRTRNISFLEERDSYRQGYKAGTPPATDLLETPGALLSRTHLRQLGLERRAVDSVFRHCPTVVLPGYSRPLIRVADYLALLEAHTYDGRTRVR